MNLSEATTKNMLSKIPTSVIVDALKEREGVKEIIIQPYEWYQITGEKEQWDHGLGPARIFVVVD